MDWVASIQGIAIQNFKFKLLTMLRDRADICSKVKITVVRTGFNTLTGLLVLHWCCMLRALGSVALMP